MKKWRGYMENLELDSDEQEDQNNDFEDDKVSDYYYKMF